MIKNWPLVSIVIPCYNLGSYLESALESVLSQTYKKIEIIIVNDGSTDEKTRQVLGRLRKRSDCKIIDKTNEGLSRARNTGISESKGTYYICLDSDDLLDKKYVEETVEKITQAGAKCGFVTTWLQEFGERKNIWKAEEYNPSKLLIENIVHAGSLVRRSAWQKAGGYKTEMNGGLEDWEFWVNLVSLGYKWEVVKKPLFLYRIRQNSMLRKNKDLHKELYQKIVSIHANYIRDHLDDYAKGVRIVLDTLLSDYQQAATDRELLEVRLQDAIRNQQNSEEALSRIINYRSVKTALKTRWLYIKFSNVRRAQVTRVKESTYRALNALTPRLVKHGLRMIRNWNMRRLLKTVYVENEPVVKGRVLVSVVVPYFNRKDTIDDTLSSLKHQTFTNFEVIVVDDGSTDLESVRYFTDLKRRHPEYTCIRQDNSGVADARNAGISMAKGRYVLCLDSDDYIDDTYLEKCALYLESHPEIAFVYTDVKTFGLVEELHVKSDFKPCNLLQDNMVTTAAVFRKNAWETAGGYKSSIGYEDWEFWINLSEHGFWGARIPEAIFFYRVAASSRYIDDKQKHQRNVEAIKKLHPHYLRTVARLEKQRRRVQLRYKTLSDSFINMSYSRDYSLPSNDKPNVLLILPWMTFGGAETLILNFCTELKGSYNIHFVTGLPSKNEWELEFRKISSRIYHAPNLYNSEDYFREFVSNYIGTRSIRMLHIIHTSIAFPALEKIKHNHPDVRVLMTVFNDRAHFLESINAHEYIDGYSSDNDSVKRHYLLEFEKLGVQKDITVIPNGINSESAFNASLYDRNRIRAELGLNDGDLAVLFFGRLSPEKNPDKFVKVAGQMEHNRHIKFFLIGDGVMSSELQEMIKGKNNIQYLGYREYSAIPQYLSATDIFVLPSSIEGFPLSILEAMAMSVAVIASDVGAVPEVVANGVDGFVVRPGSVEDISCTIERLNNDRTLLEKIKNEARNSVEKKYSNKILGKNYKDLYERTMK